MMQLSQVFEQETTEGTEAPVPLFLTLPPVMDPGEPAFTLQSDLRPCLAGFSGLPSNNDVKGGALSHHGSAPPYNPTLRTCLSPKR